MAFFLGGGGPVVALTAGMFGVDVVLTVCEDIPATFDKRSNDHDYSGYDQLV